MEEKLARSSNTPATDAGFDLLSRIAIEPDLDERYPNGTVIIAADLPNTSALIARAVSEDKPIALVFPDGSDVVASPASTRFALFVTHVMMWLADRFRRRPERPTFVPRDWVTEFHAAPSDDQLVGSR